MPFGQSAPWSVGVEEELMLVDERTFDLVAAAERVVDAGTTGLKHELFASVIEAATGICETPEHAVAEVRALRERARARASAFGLRVVAAGTHPFALPEAQPVVPIPHYLEFVEFAGPAARRQAVQGLHVHVGMPDAGTALRALEGVLGWLPVVLALSANSPFFRAHDSGFLSKRAEVLATLPRAAQPPEFRTFAEWAEQMQRWERVGVIKRYTNVWWDVRLHPDLGTLEIRIADQPTSLSRVEQLVGAVHRLAVAAAEGAPAPTARADYMTNRFAAARFGPRAELVWGDSLVTVTDLARELGLDATCEADLQLAFRDDLVGLCRDLADRSYTGVRE